MLFAFTMACTSYREKNQPTQFAVDPEKFHYAMLNFDIPNEERREALGLFTWLAHELSCPEPEDEPETED